MPFASSLEKIQVQLVSVNYLSQHILSSGGGIHVWNDIPEEPTFSHPEVICHHLL